jgi:hypothetical protein
MTAMCALSGSRVSAPFLKEFRCHNCGGSEGYASRPRDWIEKYLLPVIGLQPARCGDCYKRSWRRASARLLSRKESMRFDPEAMEASARAADGGEPRKKTNVNPEDHQRIA